MDITFRMPFLILSNIRIDINDRELRWRSYTLLEALPTTQKFELIGKKEFVATVLNLDVETCVVYVASITSSDLASLDPVVHPSHWAQIASLKVN